MSATISRSRFNLPFTAAVAGALVLSAGLAFAGDSKVSLVGADEVPAVTTAATGNGTITVNADKSVTGSVTTKGITGTAAHVHLGAPGKNGPPVITLTKTSDTVWSIPAGSKLTDEQYASYKAGDLYVNVHSAEHKGGEIRAQLKP
ncbi:MAG TPA: CHRD domain-containing protein [Steroidobacteraceae bacterium]